MQVLRRNKRVRTLARRPGLEGSLFCYKEPFMCFAIEQVAQHFPNAKFIHILRDGRDSADSLERTYPDALTDRVLQDNTLAINKNSEIGIIRHYRDFCLPWWVPAPKENDFIARSAYGRYVWMWKEMVSRTIACGRSIGSQRYLELRYEDMVVQPVENARRLLDFLGFPIGRRLLRRLNSARTDSVKISKIRQSRARLDEAAAVAGDLLRQLGYEL
jgi:hypothetical protein